MPTKPDPRIEAHLANAALFAQPILTHLRALVHRACPEVKETIKWNMPFFEHHGLLCNMAAFKAHATFGFQHQEINRLLTADGAKRDDAKGSLGRLGALTNLPNDATLLRYIRHAAKLNESGAARQPAKKAKPALPDPADLTAALKKKSAARAAWAKFPPGHRRESIEWITEAKRPETRAKRLATTLEWLAEGKPRNWKYQNG